MYSLMINSLALFGIVTNVYLPTLSSRINFAIGHEASSLVLKYLLQIKAL